MMELGGEGAIDMAIEYPDVMNDLTDARRRFEQGGVQYLAEFPPTPAAAGSVVEMTLSVQNVLDVPLKVGLRLALPELKGKLKRLPQPLFRLFRPDMGLKLEAAEVGQLIIPLQVSPHVPPGQYSFTLHVRAAPAGEGVRVRPERSENRLGDIKIRYPQGLGITQLVSWGFEAVKAGRQPIVLRVAGREEPPEEVNLKPRFSSEWTPDSWEWIPPARREVNERRIHLVPQLQIDNLYLPFMRESQSLFATAGVRLHVGEAIFVAKMLTYTVVYLMGNAEWQDCLLVPIYAFAKMSEEPTDDVVWLVTQLGYTHVLELSVALGFSLIEEVLQREPWAAMEQRAVRDFIVECIDGQAELPGEFVYLPLVLGGMAVAREVTVEGEDVRQSLQLLAKAKAAKEELFADPDLQAVNEAFDLLLRRAGA